MRRKQLNTTLSKEQLEFMEENKNKLSRPDMAKRFKCSVGKLSENARIANINFPVRNRFGIKKEKALVIDNGMFIVEKYDNWVLGFTKGRVY